jgi:hypothetical protein
MLSQKYQALDSFFSLQISQNFRASEKYSYDSYQQMRLIFDKLEYLTKNGLVKTFDLLKVYNYLPWQIF